MISLPFASYVPVFLETTSTWSTSRAKSIFCSNILPGSIAFAFRCTCPLNSLIGSDSFGANGE